MSKLVDWGLRSQARLLQRLGLAARSRRRPKRLSIDFDMNHDPGLSTDIHACLAAVRDKAPRVGWTRGEGGDWLVFGRAEIVRVLSGEDGFSTQRLLPAMAEDVPFMLPLGLDAPAHLPYRQILLRHLGPKAIPRIEPVIRRHTDSLINPLSTRARCEFMEEVAEPAALTVFMELMGLPMSRLDEFRTLSTLALDSDEERQATNAAILAVLRDVVDRCTAEPGDDLISRLVGEEIEGRRLDREEVLGLSALLFFAALDTVRNAMGFGMRGMAGDQELQDRMRRDPSTIPAATDMLLQQYSFVSPRRMATQHAKLGGASIKPGDVLRCVLWSGGQEGAPGDSRSMAFGSGPHTCVGMHLARLQLRILYETWVAHVGPFHLDPDRPARMHGGGLHGVDTLHLVMTPGSQGRG